MALSEARSSSSPTSPTSSWRCRGCGGAERRKPDGRCAACWSPWAGSPQERFLSLTCFEALYGGAAGGGKSDALLVDAVRYVGKGYGSNYKALLLRREFPELEKSLIARSRELYPRLGGRPRNDGKEWRFPGGESVHFGHCQHLKDVGQYLGTAWQFIGFDELTQFYEEQYTKLISRIRSAHGVPLRLRGATNPGSDGHDWVFKRFAPWLDPNCLAQMLPGDVAYFVKDGDKDVQVPRGTHGALGRTFIRSLLEDNPALAADGIYARTLDELDLVTREQQKKGNWLIKPAAGHYFKRNYFEIVDAAPTEVLSRVRRWDLAATEAEKGRDPDWTVGLKMSRTRAGLYYVEDVVRFRESPHKVEFAMRTTAELDGRNCGVRIPQDPGQAGKAQVEYLIKMLSGYDVRGAPETGDKVTRARPASAQAEARNIKLVRGPWNEAFIQELEQFPEGRHDDQVDALSGAFLALNEMRMAPPLRGVFSESGVGRVVQQWRNQ